MPKPPARTTGKKTTIPPKPNAAQQIAKLDQFVSGKITAPPPPPVPDTSMVSANPTDAGEKAKMKRLTLDISEDLHKAIKMQSVALGIPMVDMLRKLLETHYGKL